MLYELAERDLFMHVKSKRSFELIEAEKEKVKNTIIMKTFFLLLISDSMDLLGF